MDAAGAKVSDRQRRAITRRCLAALTQAEDPQAKALAALPGLTEGIEAPRTEW